MTEQAQTVAQGPALSQMVDQLTSFDGPPEQFLRHLLQVQCRVGGAAGGAILRPSDAQQPEVLAVYPPVDGEATPPLWLAQAASAFARVIAEGQSIEVPLRREDELYGQPAREHLVMLPMRSRDAIRGAAVFFIAATDADVVAHARQRLELTISLLSLYEMRLTLQMRTNDMQRLRTALEVLAAVNNTRRARAAAMAICNEISARWSAQRVSLGFLHGRYVKLKSISHTEKFTRKMKLVQDIESTMEECYDQDVEIIHPAADQAPYVSRAADRLATQHGPSAICSLPLRRDGEPDAVLTVEWAPDQPVDLGQIETLRLTCDLCTPRLVELHEHDRWIGARAAAGSRKVMAGIVGPRHTWAKVTAIAAALVLAFLIFAKGPDRIEAPFVLRATNLRVIPAPFNGFLDEVHVKLNESVKEGEVLATLESKELRLRRSDLLAEQASFATQADMAERDLDSSKVQINRLEAERIAAQVALIDYQLSRTQLTAPIDGVVLSTGDIEKKEGMPVETGDVLFEIAPLVELHAELAVPDDRIADMDSLELMGGELASVSHPGVYIPFRVERIHPVAEQIDQRNVFTVRVKLLIEKMDERAQWLRPGMEGVAKVENGRKPYIRLWTRKLVNWIRMKLWI
ncbi:MAG: hypothetical protein CMJ49_02880 [Planctomycetaceae bacterium]|nr:hypothetical protein [Planctomycetaceae bacterium]